MQGALPTGLRKASGGGCWSLVPAGQSERVRSPHPLCRPAFRTQTTWPPQKRREGARAGKVYLLTRAQLRHCVPKARRQPSAAPQEHSHRCSSPGTEKLQAFELSQCWPQRGILWSLALDETYTPWAGTWKPRDASSTEMLRLQLPGTAQQDVHPWSLR